MLDCIPLRVALTIYNERMDTNEHTRQLFVNSYLCAHELQPTSLALWLIRTHTLSLSLYLSCLSISLTWHFRTRTCASIRFVDSIFVALIRI